MWEKSPAEGAAVCMGHGCGISMKVGGTIREQGEDAGESISQGGGAPGGTG